MFRQKIHRKELGSYDERRYKYRKYLIPYKKRKVQVQEGPRLEYLVPSAWTLCPEMNPLRKICSSELVLILWHVHTLTQTKRTVNHLLSRPAYAFKAG